MKKQGWTVALVSGVLALGGCGGGSSSSDTNLVQIPTLNPPPAPTPTPAPTSLPVFDSNPTLLPDLTSVYSALCGKGVNVQNAAIANISGHKDGKKDLLFTLWCQPTVGALVNGPTEGGLIVVRQSSNGSFSLATKEIFGSDFVNLDGGVGGQSVVNDFNNDGYDDVIIAITGEDGRTLPPGFTGYNKKMLFLTSRGDGSYRNELIGHPSYNQYIFSVENSLGGKDVLSTAIGYGGKDQAFRLVNGTWVPSTDYVSLPSLRGSFFSSKGGGVDSAIISERADSLSLFTKVSSTSVWQKSSGGWSFANVRNASFRSWNGDVGIMPIISYQGNDYGFINFDMSCRLKLRPNDPAVSVFAVPAEKVVGGYDGRILVESSSDFTPNTLVMFFDVVNGNIKDLDVKTQKLDNQFRLFNMKCSDFNSDGFDDIFLGGWQKGVKPRILVSDKSGGFISLPNNLVPYPSFTNSNAASVYSDIDGDGIPDLLYWPVTGLDSLDGGVKYQMFRGRRNIASSDL